jgi:hypothetical protein
VIRVTGTVRKAPENNKRKLLKCQQKSAKHTVILLRGIIRDDVTKVGHLATFEKSTKKIDDSKKIKISSK